jgi:hypothetical protein
MACGLCRAAWGPEALGRSPTYLASRPITQDRTPDCDFAVPVTYLHLPAAAPCISATTLDSERESPTLPGKTT